MFRAGASPSLSHMYRDIAQSLDHPTDKGRTLWDAKKDHGKLMGNKTIVAAQEAVGGPWQPLRDTDSPISIKAVDNLGVSALGSGSDFTPFLAYLGIASINTGFSSTRNDPVWHYHSIFDTQTWQERFGDPGFKRHVCFIYIRWVFPVLQL
jgi:N-acetylated-alpha-linked acidic dipeptidase